MISLLTSEDAAAWRDIRLEALNECPAAFLESYADAAQKPAEEYVRQIERNALFVWRDVDGNIAGVLGFYVEKGTHQKHRGHAWGMYVRPSYRGKGIASALIETVVRHAKTSGVTQLHLGAETTSASAVALYQKHGFEIYGTDPNTVCINGMLYSDHLMVKML